MKLIVDALARSFNGIYNVYIVTALIWLKYFHTFLEFYSIRFFY
jgi:hypothetical protein